MGHEALAVTVGREHLSQEVLRIVAGGGREGVVRVLLQLGWHHERGQTNPEEVRMYKPDEAQTTTPKAGARSTIASLAPQVSATVLQRQAASRSKKK